MNKQIVRTLSVALLATATVFAQGPHTLNVKIPFGFHVGNSNFAAGSYVVDDATPSVLRFRSADFKSGIMILSSPVQKLNAPTEGKLIFNRYGDEYFLSQVWRPGVNTGSELRKTKRESEMSARANPDAESITARK
jgi:hypothetical protein